jgi:hypothetical protein
MALQMSYLRCWPPFTVVAFLLVGFAAFAEDQPQLLPMRDVDVTYDVTRPQQPKIRERVRWLAGEHLERVDGPDKSTTIFDRDANEITLLTPANRSYRKLDGTARRPLEPEPGTALKRGGDAIVAGLHCTDWSWTEDVETHVVCVTPDGVLLRHVVDGQTVMQAHSVNYDRQAPELFQVPKDYAPALAPEGGTSD